MSAPFVITIGRQLASGGRSLGRRLSEELGIAYYDKEILSMAAAESGLGPGIFERSDERKGFLRSIFNVVQPFIGGGGDFYEGQLSDENLFTIQSRVIQKVANERSCIFIGRVADYILRQHPKRINLFVAADMADRVQRLVEREKITAKAALERLEESDEQRANYYNFYSSGTWASADTYDLCINTSKLGLDASFALLRSYVSERLAQLEQAQP